ncbi:MAG: glycosyltransferase family A protein [Planctomycetota bacterium]
MTDKITISAVIPAYNAEKYIARAIDSVLAQTCPVNEIIVVDDGSTDNTAAIIKGYGDKVRYIYQPNAGVSAARNAGIEAATGNWIAFLDADDEWLPKKIELQVESLKKCPDLVWATGNYFTCSCSEQRRAPRVEPTAVETLLKRTGMIGDFFIGSKQGMAEHTDTMLIRKDAILAAGLFDTTFSKAEDLDLWWKIAHQNPAIGYISQPIAIHHFGNETSLNKVPMKGPMITMLIGRHQVLARGTATEQSFNAMTVNRLRSWMRGMLFGAQIEDIRQLLRQFRELLPAWYRGLMYVLTLFPRLTQAVCLLLSKIVRKLHLRRRVVVPPNISKNY